MVKTNDPGIARIINQFLIGITFENVVTSNRVLGPQTEVRVSTGFWEGKAKKKYSEISAALPRTVKSTARYSVVPQNQCPESRPSASLRSPQKRIIENPYNILNKASAIVCNIQVETDQAMIQCISNPEPERRFGKKFIFLAKYVELGVSIQNSCGYKLIKNANYERRKDSENDIIHWQGPWFVCNLAGEVVEEWILPNKLVLGRLWMERIPNPELCHIQHNVLIKGILKKKRWVTRSFIQSGNELTKNQFW